MGIFPSFPNLFVALLYINNIFDSKDMVFDTNIITSKSLKLKCKLRRLRESGPCPFVFTE